MSDPYSHLEGLRQAVERIGRALDNIDPEPGMFAVADANTAITYLATEFVEQGVQAGMTQRRMARALDVPESALRGARRELRGVAS